MDGALREGMRHPRVRASAYVLVGVVATTVGAGLGIRHLQKIGVTGESVFGLHAVTSPD